MRHRARKRFGQNFLTDDRIIQRIVDVIDPRDEQLILEIGPGRAALTLPLARSGAEMVLLELDRDLAHGLETRFAGSDHISVISGDALKLDFSEVSDDRPFRLVGNLPYNISTPLLFHVLQWSELIIDMHFMLQQEVVNRMAAVPGTKAWGKLSVMCQYHCTVTPLFNVPPEAFRPAPKVQSSIVRLTPHDQPPVSIDRLDVFEKFLSRVFSQRRKTLRNSLRGVLDTSSIEAAGIDPGLRPEMLSLEQFAVLYRRLEE